MRRLRLVPDNTNIDFFAIAKVTFGGSMVLVVASIVAGFVFGLNFGIDFLGGTTIRTDAKQPVAIAQYRSALNSLNLGDIQITQVYDLSFGPDEHVASIRVSAQKGQESMPKATLTEIEGALKKVDPTITFQSVDSVGPKVSGELI